MRPSGGSPPGYSRLEGVNAAMGRSGGAFAAAAADQAAGAAVSAGSALAAFQNSPEYKALMAAISGKDLKVGGGGGGAAKVAVAATAKAINAVKTSYGELARAMLTIPDFAGAGRLPGSRSGLGRALGRQKLTGTEGEAAMKKIADAIAKAEASATARIAALQKGLTDLKDRLATWPAMSAGAILSALDKVIAKLAAAWATLDAQQKANAIKSAASEIIRAEEIAKLPENVQAVYAQIDALTALEAQYEELANKAKAGSADRRRPSSRPSPLPRRSPGWRSSFRTSSPRTRWSLRPRPRSPRRRRRRQRATSRRPPRPPPPRRPPQRPPLRRCWRPSSPRPLGRPSRVRGSGRRSRRSSPPRRLGRRSTSPRRST